MHLVRMVCLVQNGVRICSDRFFHFVPFYMNQAFASYPSCRSNLLCWSFHDQWVSPHPSCKKKLFFRRRLSLIQLGIINERGLGDADIKVLIICVVLSGATNCKCELKLPLTHSKVNVKVLCYHNERKNAILYHFKRPCNKLGEKGLRIWGWSKHRGKLIRVTKLCFGLVNFRNH